MQKQPGYGSMGIEEFNILEAKIILSHTSHIIVDSEGIYTNKDYRLVYTNRAFTAPYKTIYSTKTNKKLKTIIFLAE